MFERLFNKKAHEPKEILLQDATYKCIRKINLFSEKKYKEGDTISFEEFYHLPMIVKVYHFEGPLCSETSYYKDINYMEKLKDTHDPPPDFENPESKGKHDYKLCHQGLYNNKHIIKVKQ